jgi:hypothetical protein
MTSTEWEVVHDPDGYACNMGYVLRGPRGEVYRGPEWAANLRLYRITGFPQRIGKPRGPSRPDMVNDQGIPL